MAIQLLLLQGKKDSVLLNVTSAPLLLRKPGIWHLLARSYQPQKSNTPRSKAFLHIPIIRLGNATPLGATACQATLPRVQLRKATELRGLEGMGRRRKYLVFESIGR